MYATFNHHSIATSQSNFRDINPSIKEAQLIVNLFYLLQWKMTGTKGAKDREKRDNPQNGNGNFSFLILTDSSLLGVLLVSLSLLVAWGGNEGTDVTDWLFLSHDLNPIEHLWDIMYRCIRHCQVPSGTVQELTDALVQVWEETPRDHIRRGGPCPHIVGSAYTLLSHIMSCHHKIHWFLAWFWIQPLMMMILVSIYCCKIILFSKNYTMYINNEYQLG